MIGYKWLTKDKKAFYNGHQFVYGWNREDGPKDGVCCAGGYHVLKSLFTPLTIAAGSSHIDAEGTEVACYKVFYLQRDVLGYDSTKVRVRAFKLLKKKPCKLDMVKVYPTNNPYVAYYSTTTDTSACGSSTYGSSNITWTFY